jgi:lysophospholipase L1-like esterase
MRQYSVQIISILSIFSFVLLLFGFGWSIQNHLFGTGSSAIPKAEATAPEQTEEGKTIVALGDSLTRGIGDAAGKGYIGYVADMLQDKSKEKINLFNLSVKGYRSEQLLYQVKQHEIQRQIQGADAIVMTIGGNDLFQRGQTLLELDLQNIVQLREEYLGNLQQIIMEISARNQEATIYFIGLYNPFIDLSDAARTTKAVRQWNYQTSELLDQYPQVVFVPTFDLFQMKVNDYLFSDQFHPNTAGYQLIAERVVSLITW